jgi:hypothetical protein
VLGSALDHLRCDDRAERVAEYDDARAGQPLLEILGELDAVARDAIQLKVRRVLSMTTERAARAALIPLHDREGRLVWRKFGRERGERYPGAAVDVQQDGVGPVVASNRYPLLEPTDRDEACLFDALALRARAGGAGGWLRVGTRRKRHESRRDRYADTVGKQSPHATAPLMGFRYGVTWLATRSRAASARP